MEKIKGIKEIFQESNVNIPATLYKYYSNFMKNNK